MSGGELQHHLPQIEPAKYRSVIRENSGGIRAKRSGALPSIDSRKSSRRTDHRSSARSKAASSQKPRRTLIERQNDAADKARSSRSFFSSKLTQQHSPSALVDFDVTAGQDESTRVDKKSLCIDILTEGYVSSFIEFFYLTHRTQNAAAVAAAAAQESNSVDAGSPAAPAAAAAAAAAQSFPSAPEEELQYIKQNLVHAEQAHRSGDSTGIHAAYKAVGDYYKKTSDFRTAVYFYEKCRDVAESIGDLQKQCQTNLDLGITHDLLGLTLEAIQYHEAHLAIADDINHEDGRQIANRNLEEVYRKHATELERQGRNEEAIAFFEKCLKASATTGDLKHEGLANYKIGLIFANDKMNNPQKAAKYQKRYLEICMASEDQIGEGQAYSALAKCFQAMGDTTYSIKYLRSYLDIATEKNQPVAQAKACAALGAIYTEQGNHKEAVEFFEKNFAIARALGDRTLVDEARINVGVARANVDMRSFMGMCFDLPQLLQWKANRSKPESEEEDEKSK